MRPRRQINVRTQGVLAAGTALVMLLVVALVGLRFASDDASGDNRTPTIVALITPAPTGSVAPGSDSTPAGVDVSPTPNSGDEASPVPSVIHNDQWGVVVEAIADDKSAQMFRGSVARSGEYKGDALSGQPEVAWQVGLGDENYSAPVVRRDRILVGGNDDTLKCLDTATGEEVWSYESGDDISSSPAIGSNKVFFGSFDGNFYAVDLDNGRRKWRFETSEPIHSSPAVDGSLVYFGGYDRVLYALSVEDGTLAWAAVTGGKIQSSPAVSGEMVFIGSDDGFLYAIDRLTGRRLWRVDTGGKVTSTPALVGDMVFVASESGRVLGLNTADGEVVWDYDAGSAITFSSPAIDANTLVVGTDGGRLVALRADRGSERWTFEAGAEIRSSPIIVGGQVYFGSYDQHLYAVDLASGDEVWSLEQDGIVGSPVYADGMLFVSLNSGQLLALTAG